MKFLNLITLLGVITVNALANILPINGVTTGDVSAMYDNYFTPAGFTFGIWSVIYLGLIVFVFYQYFSKTYNPNVIGYLFIVNGLANMSWILAWHYSYFLMTVLIIGVILWTLIVINLRVKDFSRFVKLPFRIYLGWICVATIANVAVYLKYLDVWIVGSAEVVAAFLLVIIGAAIGLMMLLKKGWILATLAVAWGIWGIYQKQNESNQSDIFTLVCLITSLTLSFFCILRSMPKWGTKILKGFE
jgi:hypothetical protein